MNNLIHLITISLLLASCSSGNNSNKLNWKECANGVWKCSIGNKSSFSLLEAAGATPKLAELDKKNHVSFPLNKDLISVKDLDGKLYLRFPLDDKEQIYGLGLHFKSIKRRGRVYNLHVDHYGGKDNGRTHAPVPFYVSDKGYGVLINSAEYITVYTGSSVRTDSPDQPEVRDRNTDRNWTASPTSDAVEILVPADNTEIIVFGGESILDVVSRYNLFCGGGCLPPKWGLGFTYRAHTLSSDQDIIKLSKEFEDRGFPLDFIGLEPGWQSASYPCTYAWDPGRFPEPEKFVRELLASNVRTNLWMNPYIAPGSPIYDKMLSYSGSHSVWTGIVPDYSVTEAQKIFTDYIRKEVLNIGVSGFKIDECDGFDRWLWPDVTTFPSGISAEQLRQTYGLILQQMITEMYHANNTRTYGLVRASNAGGASLPFVIYNDYYSHPDFITALINSGFCGVLWTPEARSSKTGEEWLRRMQSVCFSPMAMINAWASGTRPWSFPDVYEDVKSIANLRMRLLPYIYSSFAQYHFQGLPPIRSMVMYEGFISDDPGSPGILDDTENPYQQAKKREIKDQFMFGDNILVAPMFTGQESRKVVLPEGKWYDFYDGSLVGGNEIIEVVPGLGKIPLFVKDGGIIPMIPASLHVPRKGDVVPLEVRHYGSDDGSFLLYDDDGETFNYENGEYSLTELTVINLSGNVERLDNNIFGYRNISWKFMTK